jgi:hypothetical protein
MMESESVVLQLHKPASLPSVKFLQFLEILEIGVVSPDFKGGNHVDEIALKVLQGDHDHSNSQS